MSMSSPAIKQLARRLLANTATSVDSSDPEPDPSIRACQRLRVPLVKLAGVAGFATLLLRALSLAKRQDPSLDGLRVEPDGSLVRASSPPNLVPPAANLEDAVLLAELLGLLVLFIGESLTLTLVREAWPEVSVPPMSISIEEKQ